MSDADSDSDGGNRTSDTERSDSDSTTTATRVRRSLDYVFLGGLVLFGLVAAVQFYFAADRAIAIWVTREFRPLFKMAFNLAVLLVVGIGVTRQLQRLTGDGGEGADERRTEPETS